MSIRTGDQARGANCAAMEPAPFRSSEKANPAKGLCPLYGAGPCIRNQAIRPRLRQAQRLGFRPRDDDRSPAKSKDRGTGRMPTPSSSAARLGSKMPRDANMKWLAMLVVAFVGALLAYLVLYPTTSYRFRITLNVDTPQGLRSGSSVMEVRTRRYPAWTTLGNNTGQSSLTGEAVFVDLGPDVDSKPRNVLALLAWGPRGENVDFYLLPDLAFRSLWKQKVSSPDFRGSSWELPKLPVGHQCGVAGRSYPHAGDLCRSQ